MTAEGWRWTAITLSAVAVASGLYGIFMKNDLAGRVGIAAMWIGLIASELYRRPLLEKKP